MQRVRSQKHYHLNVPKFVHNIIVPLQAAVGVLLLFGTVGAMDTTSIEPVQALVQIIVSLLLVVGIAIY